MFFDDVANLVWPMTVTLELEAGVRYLYFEANSRDKSDAKGHRFLATQRTRQEFGIETGYELAGHSI